MTVKYNDYYCTIMDNNAVVWERPIKAVTPYFAIREAINRVNAEFKATPTCAIVLMDSDGEAVWSHRPEDNYPRIEVVNVTAAKIRIMVAVLESYGDFCIDGEVAGVGFEHIRDAGGWSREYLRKMLDELEEDGFITKRLYPCDMYRYDDELFYYRYAPSAEFRTKPLHRMLTAIYN